MPIYMDPNLGQNVFDPSTVNVPQQAAPRQMPMAARSTPWQGMSAQTGVNPLLAALASLYGAQARNPQPDYAAQQANTWGNNQGITPENQWDNRWKLINNNSPLGVWARASLRQDYGGGPEISNQAPGAGPFLGTSRPASSGTNWESFPAGGGDIVYSGSQVPSWERGAVKNIDPLYDFYARNQNAMAGYW